MVVVMMMNDNRLQMSFFQALDENDGTFVEEVFSGCVRFEPIISVVIDGFYNRDGKLVLRSEEYIYRGMTNDCTDEHA